MSTIRSRNNVKVTGNGSQPIVFAHGFGCDQSMWRFVAPAFEKNYRVILFDHIGSGKSDLLAYDNDRHGRLTGYAEDLLQICDDLQLEDPIFVGHSVSGMIGLLASLRRPDYFKHLILIAPSPRYINDLPDYIGGFEQQDIEELLSLMQQNHLGWARFLAPIIMGNPGQPELTAELHESFCVSDPMIIQQFAQITFMSDYRAELQHVTAPALILQCDQDYIAPLEVGAYMHQQMPHSIFQLMEATGHCPHMSHPDETISLIEEYLAQSVTEMEIPR
ncbi:alpha/beta fold hydrolase [Paenibacillus bovis]|uniref:Sigma factor SigB regulation protein RsbQ n=1 Tax=Paenibacillus bovis TaxID=1616788 RepID=A0A172ZIT0_9BACL|nr:alpha/beta hydrolase [Paenibacillus bovis]ANF97040.1 sigma factor SigB regulation protein RsbQ [Paenibacillus bovis]